MRQVIVGITSVLLIAVFTGRGGAKASAAFQAVGPPQSSSQSSSQISHPGGIDRDVDGPDMFKDHIEAQAARNRTSERQKRMAADTARLLQLSTELKAEVDKTTKDEMSVQAIQKAAEIEKLAHDVKERMKGL